MNAVSEDIKSILVSESVFGLTFASDLFIGKTPETPDDLITIIDTSGGSPETSLDSESYYRSSVQIRVRNNSYPTGWILLNDIMNSLHGRAQETWGGTLYSVITASSEPAFVGWDDNGRALFSINFNLRRR